MRQLTSRDKQRPGMIDNLFSLSEHTEYNSNSIKITSSARAVRKKFDRKSIKKERKLQTLEKAEKGKSACFLQGYATHDPANASARVNVIFPYR